MLYQMLNGQHWRHIYIVGDLHGCRSLLDAQLIAQGFDIEKDLLVSVGDLIDRGPDSLGCLRLLDAPWFRSVRGNHEEMALQALAGGSREMWQRNGGNWFWSMKGAAMVSARHALKRCSKLPLIVHLQLGERVVVVAHADYPPIIMLMISRWMNSRWSGAGRALVKSSAALCAISQALMPFTSAIRRWIKCWMPVTCITSIPAPCSVIR